MKENTMKGAKCKGKREKSQQVSEDKKWRNRIERDRGKRKKREKEKRVQT